VIVGGHKTISGSSYPVPAPPTPPPVADYHIEGDPDPNCKGDYFYGGIHDGVPYYSRGDGVYHIWSSSALEEWLISIVVGLENPPWWYKDTGPRTGMYQPSLLYTGNPVVITGPA
jgi:hypothetical protein